MDVDTDYEANNIGPIFHNLMSESFRVSWWFCFRSWNYCWVVSLLCETQTHYVL